MIYANITHTEDIFWKGYYLEFHWENSIQETDLWDWTIMNYCKSELQKEMFFDGKYLKFRSIILAHLAERWFIPWSDSIFYKKSFIDFFR